MKHYFCHFYKLSLFFTAIFLLCGCEQPTVEKISGEAQGTTYHISFWSAQPTNILAIKQAVDDEFKRIDQLLSNYRPDSAIEQLNSTLSSEPQAVNEEIIALIEQARTVSVASANCYDLTIKPLFDLWGFKTNKFSPPSQEILQSTLQEVGFEKILIVDKTHLRKLNPELKIDLSSIAQGHTVGRIAAILEQQGIDNYLVEIGGELQTRGHKPEGVAWRIALEKPLSEERTLQKIITIEQAEPLSVMTSGTYRHYFDDHGKRYSHILDARTGIPVGHSTVSVTVFHNNPTQADSWSTALLCLGRVAGLEAANKAGIAALFIEQQDKSFNEFSSAALQVLHTVTIK